MIEEFKEDEYYLIFVLGYDLLHDKIMSCDNKCCDDVFHTMKEIIKMFLESEECRNYALSTYDALKEFLCNHEFEINVYLYNELDYRMLGDF